MLLSHRKNSLTSLFKEVRVFKEPLLALPRSLEPVPGAPSAENSLN